MILKMLASELIQVGIEQFAGETVASPFIRAYSVVKGVRSGLGAITDLPGFVKGRRRSGRKKKKR